MVKGAYHADLGDLPAVGIPDPKGAEEANDTVAVLSDGLHGSGLSVGWTVLHGVTEGDATGQWTPAK